MILLKLITYNNVELEEMELEEALQITNFLQKYGELYINNYINKKYKVEIITDATEIKVLKKYLISDLKICNFEIRVIQTLRKHFEDKKYVHKLITLSEEPYKYIARFLLREYIYVVDGVYVSHHLDKDILLNNMDDRKYLQNQIDNLIATIKLYRLQCVHEISYIISMYVDSYKFINYLGKIYPELYKFYNKHEGFSFKYTEESKIIDITPFKDYKGYYLIGKKSIVLKKQNGVYLTCGSVNKYQGIKHILCSDQILFCDMYNLRYDPILAEQYVKEFKATYSN